MNVFVVLEDRDGGDYGVVETKPLKVVTSKEAAALEVMLQQGAERQRLAELYTPCDYYDKIQYSQWDFVLDLEKHVKFYYTEVPSNLNSVTLAVSNLVALLDDDYKGRA